MQVHVVLSEVDNPDSHVDCDVNSDEDDQYVDPEEENLSDTDPEDYDWEVSACAFVYIMHVVKIIDFQRISQRVKCTRTSSDKKGKTITCISDRHDRFSFHLIHVLYMYACIV